MSHADAAGAAATGAVPFSQAISRQPIRGWSIAAFAICMLVLICDGMDAQLLGIVAPKVIEDFGVDRGTFGLAMSAALVGFGLGSWGGGWLGDTIGRRWSLALSTVVFSLATIGASLAADVEQMAAWRLVGGLGFGGAYATAITLAGDWLPDRWRSVGVTTMSVGTPAGGTVVGFMAPGLLEDYGWRGAFVIVGGLTLLVLLLIIFALREGPSFLLSRGKVEQAHKVAARVLDEPFTLAPEVHPTDLDGKSTGVFASTNTRFNIGVGLAFGSAALMAYGMLNWGTTFLTAKGFGFELAAYAVSVGGITSIVSSILAGLLVQKFGSRIVQLGLGVALAATLLVLLLKVNGMDASSSSADQTLVVALFGLAAALFSCAVASMYALMTHGYPPSCRSAGIGFGIFMSRVGAVAASLFGGTLIDMGDGSLAPYFGVLIAAAGLLAVATFVIDRHVPPARATRTAG
ncbi:MFS transporter [Alteraurantiacibacter buctensis]|uniref:MFS transporter n=1 Tax=Alteraurantiacibacter buctensis TaxID=1503981 RepID=A0A844Z1D0_9SPHN|nr:MFS transporter [Alteraurantiacibacter buctensis]MXO72960.1 MFS transporter [Alteraurantiacibacter buctensis]